MSDLQTALSAAVDGLMAERQPEGCWVGELSSSALSTATALSTFAVAAPTDTERISRGVAWLAQNQNDDGGWGDTTDSPTNLATTLLGIAACRLAEKAGVAPPAGSADRAVKLVCKQYGALRSACCGGLAERYGEDRTFAVPIMMNCALAELVEWQAVPPLPFELAALPNALFRALRLHVVSYALPALIAIGQLLHVRNPQRGVRGVMRSVLKAATLRKLAVIQPESGGFLEAIPLTAFVVMSLAAQGGELCRNSVVEAGLRFLRSTQREDGSWPIDSNLACWVTSLSIQALAGELPDREGTREWLAACQVTERHPYTKAAPGGWGWTNLSGAVPDGDDTPGALIALSLLGEGRQSRRAQAGVFWLLGLQNRDGGWPTFCRGWQKLPFDRSSPDLTAHVCRALTMWRDLTPPRVDRAVATGLRYLTETQREDGAWVPLWFGNQRAAEEANPVYGTGMVLRGLSVVPRAPLDALAKGAAFLVAVQNEDGGWGGGVGVPSSVEETGVALAALSAWLERVPRRSARIEHDIRMSSWPRMSRIGDPAEPGEQPGGHLPSGNPASSAAVDACGRAARYLVDRIEAGTWRQTTPIGLYFAKLWYSERLYPLVWTVDGLRSWQKHCPDFDTGAPRGPDA